MDAEYRNLLNGMDRLKLKSEELHSKTESLGELAHRSLTDLKTIEARDDAEMHTIADHTVHGLQKISENVGELFRIPVGLRNQI
jgi:hypothetical protein